MQTLSNDFHGTSIKVRSARAALTALSLYRGEGTPAQQQMARRILARLCGSPSCTCGVVRGPQAQ